MYRVLLVDDEPLILSGIKFLIDWHKQGCEIVDTARNGQIALEKIHALHPDIVLCDISMPVLSGTELLALAAQQSPATVFIMLTNHPDFHLAQESLRFRAVDYLLKSQLTAESLERSLAIATAECTKRSRLAQAEIQASYLAQNSRQLLHNAILHMVQAPVGMSLEKTEELLEGHAVLQGFGMAYIPLQLSAQQETSPQEVFKWEMDIATKIAETIFANSLLFCPDEQYQSIFLLCWGDFGQQWQQKVETLTTKLETASSTIAKVQAKVLATDFFAGKDKLEECRRQLFLLRDFYYLTGEGRTSFSTLAPLHNQPLGLTGLAGRLTAECNGKNAAGVALLLDRAIQRVSTTPHQKSQAVWLCGEVCGAVQNALGSDAPTAQRGPAEIERLCTKEQVVHWLTQLRNEVCAQLEQHAGGSSQLVEAAKQYVQDNLEKRIMLQDAANHLCISPGYLSALFKKVYNQNFVDYVNSVKMERACALIREQRYRIYEISAQLSFENAYYFSRVFKRHTGMTPTEYQKKHTQAGG